MFKLNILKILFYINKTKQILFLLIIFTVSTAISSENSFSTTKEPKVSINGSGLKIPRVVSLKNSLTYMRTGPGKEFPVKFEFIQKGYPLKIIAEYNNWRKVKTFNNITGWIHTQLLSSFRTALIVESTFLKNMPSDSGNSLAKLLPDLLINVKDCLKDWCKVEIINKKTFLGWVKKESIWGSTKN